MSDDELRARIVRAARERLGRLREVPRPWWEWTASWARVAVPVGLAASLAAGALLVGAPASTDSSAGLADTVSVSGVVLGAATGAGGLEVADQLVARASDDWLLLQIMSR